MKCTYLAGHKVNIQMLITFPYNSNDQVEFEIIKKIPFTLAPYKKKYLSIYQVLYTWSVWEKLPNCDEREKIITK